MEMKKETILGMEKESIVEAQEELAQERGATTTLEKNVPYLVKGYVCSTASTPLQVDE